MRRPNWTCYQRSHIGKVVLCTTRRRFRTSQHGDENDRCSVSSRLAKHNVFYPSIAAFIITFSFAATSLLLPITALRDTLLSVSGVI